LEKVKEKVEGKEMEENVRAMRREKAMVQYKLV